MKMFAPGPTNVFKASRSPIYPVHPYVRTSCFLKNLGVCHQTLVRSCRVTCRGRSSFSNILASLKALAESGTAAPLAKENLSEDWEQFQRTASGEWEGITATFNSRLVLGAKHSYCLKYMKCVCSDGLILDIR